MSAEDDDIDRLLREIDSMGLGSDSSVPAKPTPKEVAKPGGKEVAGGESGSGRGRTQWALVSAAGAGVVGLILGTLFTWLPYVGGISTALGAALGAALVALVAGPPGWFGKD